jgi:hypothetical protein
VVDFLSRCRLPITNLPKLPITPFERSRPAADASREVHGTVVA